MNALDRYKRWREHARKDAEIYAELEEIKGDEAEIENRFGEDLTFGTGGLRGVIGAGTSRMNGFTVSRASQGYAKYLLSQKDRPTVAIAYDSRKKSEVFAKIAAGVFAANGIRAHIYPELMPTPALSFAVRYLKADGGIVITASHNPAKYNGYKVYDASGCQITDDAAEKISREIKAVDMFSGVRSIPYEEGIEKGIIKRIEARITRAYLEAVSGLSQLEASVDRSAPIAYTPLHGAGIQCVPQCLEMNGFKNITMPLVQSQPDGNFPTCPSPNPEMREALGVGIEWAKENRCEMLLATDPDCDRVGVAVSHQGEFRVLTGNQIGVLLLDFVCRMRVGSGRMPESPLAVKTIVTSPMADKVAEKYGVKMIDVLTGFKYIGEQINHLEEAGEHGRYILGFEESCGYLSGIHVRDKDGVGAALLICEMFAFCRARGETLWDAMRALYKEHGFYADRLKTYALEGVEGAMRMRETMTRLREKTPWEIGGAKVVAVSDYERSATRYDDGREEEIRLPRSNVLKLWLKDGGWVVVRPSGTEPKMKVYFSGREKCLPASEKAIDRMADEIKWLMSRQE